MSLGWVHAPPAYARELVDLGREIESLERPKAMKRQGQRNDLRTSGSEEQEVPQPSTRAKVAEALGMSEPTYQRAKLRGSSL